jgi:hypothetical protein
VALSVHSRIRLAFAVVLLLGAALSAFVYVNGRSVLNVSEPLLRQQLGLLETISRLRLTLAAQEPVLYEYYATQERDVFRGRFLANDRSIGEDLAALDNGYRDAGRRGRIRADDVAIRGLADQLDQTLRVYGSEPVDWDRARELLVEVSSTGRRINAELDILAASSQAEVAAAREATREQIRRVVQAVFAFSLLLGVIAALLGYFVSSYLEENAERMRMETELRFYAYHDAVTGLPNRVSFERTIGALEGGTPAALLLLNSSFRWPRTPA